MPEPEIVRRCPHCGASIRVRAFFCPQCGEQLAGGQSVGEATIALDQSEFTSLSETVAERFNEPPSVAGAPLTEGSSQSKPNGLAGSRKKKQKRDEAAARTQPIDPSQLPAPNDNNSDAQPTAKLPVQNAAVVRDPSLGVPEVYRATSSGRETTGSGVMPRVEKLRKVSSVVIDEAAYDPSLRFVLVAAALFVIFLIIVFLSKLIG